MGFPTSHQPTFYTAPNFLKMGIKYLNLSFFWTTSTIQDEKSAAKFDYIKTLSGKVVAQSIAFRVVSTHWQEDDSFPLKSWLQVTYPPPPEGSEFWHILTCSASTVRDRKRRSINLHLTRTRHVLSSEPSTKILRRPKLPQNADKVPKFVVFWTISTIKYVKSAAKFLSGKIIAQSIAFRVVSIYWQGVAPFPWYLNAEGPTRIWSTCVAYTLPIARQPWRYCVTSLHSAHWLASGLKLAACCPDSGCWPSCHYITVHFNNYRSYAG